MDAIAPPFERLLRRATGRTAAVPLLRALGFDAALRPVPPDALGLDGEAAVRGLFDGGALGGLRLLVVELAPGAEPAAGVRLARRVHGRNAAVPWLFVLAWPRWTRIGVLSFGLEGEARQLLLERGRPRATDIAALEELAARPGEGGTALALRHARALDRSRITRHFFRDFKAQRARVASEWRGIPRALRPEREQLALLLICRLMFLFFLQREGHLAGDREYLRTQVAGWRRGRRAPAATAPGGTFFRAVLGPLFFGALNTRPERRTEDARALGPLPYLNGGLFERHALERRFAGLDLPDPPALGVFDDLLERYRFTTREQTEALAGGATELGIDPEMLGRVFEGLMAPDRRGATGTFYTPAPVVDRIVRTALEVHVSDRLGVARERAGELLRGGEPPAEPSLGSRAAAIAGALRVLDPACGSGAFLLGALSRVAELRARLSGEPLGEARRAVVGTCLHGLDVQEDAALLCSLRLWLALTTCGDGTPPPLPNLDRRVRQGDALVDPLDLAGGDEAVPPWRAAASDPAVRLALRRMAPLSERYVGAEPEEKEELKRELVTAERSLADAWIAALGRRAESELAELLARAASRDLFGDVPADAIRARASSASAARRVEELRAVADGMKESRALPFFSFPVHFPEAAAAGFDLILSNPPWVRSHRWPAPLRNALRRRFAVCRGSGWRHGADLGAAPGRAGGQVDLSLLFLERSIRLLRPGGTLAMVVPAKCFRSLYGAGARRLLLRETRLAELEDHALDQRSIFRADAFVGVVVATRAAGDAAARRRRSDAAGSSGSNASVSAVRAIPPAGGATSTPAGVRVTMVRRGVPALRFCVSPDELPLVPGDAGAPWLLAPPGARAALRRMQAAGPPLGHHEGLRVRRGVVTAANDVLLVRSAEPKLGDLAWIRAEGHGRARRDGRGSAARKFAALVEGSALRPLVRGSGIGAWRWRPSGHVVWVHGDRTGSAEAPPPRMARYLDRHAPALRARSGWRPGAPDGALFRVYADTLRHKVAWHDLAETLNAVALPPVAAAPDGRLRPLIPLNTVYFIPVSDDRDALLLAALFNSLPVRTFARAAAERAKDARFRFFAWTIAMLPLPRDWRLRCAAAGLPELSLRAHGRGGMEPEEQARLDRVVAALYGLREDDLAALGEFDRWLRGEAGA